MYDYIIVGQGLAGTVLAWTLLQRNCRVLVLDRDEALTSSKVAAGLITPITGKQLAKTSDLDTLLPCARKFYREVESLTSSVFFHELPVVRLLRNEKEAQLWENRKQRTDYTPYLETLQPLDERILSPLGAFQMQRGGYLDVRRFIEVSRDAFRKQGCWQCAVVDADNLTVADGHVEWEGLRANRMVFCQGFEGNQNRFFDWIPFRSAKGEILTIRFLEKDFPRERVLNKAGKWLLPSGGESFRTGSTYSWDPLDTVSTGAGRDQIIRGVKTITTCDFEIEEQEAAVRPIINASNVLMGLHPKHAQLGFFNGLGSKGVTMAPWHAAHFADHLEKGTRLIEAIDLQQNRV